MVPNLTIFILWYHGTICMQKHPTVDKKLADWVSAFNLIPNKQNQEAQILKSLILANPATPKNLEVIEAASC